MLELPTGIHANMDGAVAELAALVAASRRQGIVALHGGCCIKPSRKNYCAIAEMPVRATGCEDLGTDAPGVTDAMADFGTHP